MQLRKRRVGAHRTYLSGRARIAGAALVAALAVGGGAVAVEAADAQPATQQRLGILGTMTLCVRGVPTSMDYAGDQGDWGNSNRPLNGSNWVQLLTGPGPNPDHYAFQLTHVGTRGEWIGFTVHCTSNSGFKWTQSRRFFLRGPGNNAVLFKDF